MEIDRICKVKPCDDETEIELSGKAASRSKILKDTMADYPEDKAIPLNTVKKATLLKIKDYLEHYKDKDPDVIEKPLKSKDFKSCVEDWAFNFIGDDNEEILSLHLAANYLDIKSLIELTSAKLASKIKENTTEKIRREFKITALNNDEEKQLNEDKKIILNEHKEEKEGKKAK